MENQNQGSVNAQFNQQFGQQNIPNANAILVLGIISIALCWCYGVVGLVCGIIALVLGSKSMNLLKGNPTAYTESSVKNMKAGRVCAIIGTSLSALFLIYVIFWIVFVGSFVRAAFNPFSNHYY